jgi:hypothetical protein
MVERYAHLMPPEMVIEIQSVWGPTHPRIGQQPKPKRAKSVQKKAGRPKNWISIA